MFIFRCATKTSSSGDVEDWGTCSDECPKDEKKQKKCRNEDGEVSFILVFLNSFVFLFVYSFQWSSVFSSLFAVNEICLYSLNLFLKLKTYSHVWKSELNILINPSWVEMLSCSRCSPTQYVVLYCRQKVLKF